jgi:hypothetical protein
MKKEPKDPAKDLKKLQDDGAVYLAMKTESGRVLMETVAEGLEENYQAILTRDLTDAQLLALVHECRGLYRSLGKLSVRIRRAHSFAVRRAVQQQLNADQAVG